MKLLSKPKPAGKKRLIRITHHQTVRQSEAYNSAECSLSLSVECEDDPKIMNKEIDRLEAIVESRLADKSSQQREFLTQLARAGRGGQR